MSTHALTAGAAGFAPAGKPVARSTRSLMGRVKSWLEARRTMRELSQLSDRELADIGLVRDDIPAVARGLRR